MDNSYDIKGADVFYLCIILKDPNFTISHYFYIGGVLSTGLLKV